MWRQMLALVAEEGILREAVLDDALDAVVRCDGVLALVAEEGVLREAILDDALEAVVRCEGMLALVVILCDSPRLSWEGLGGGPRAPQHSTMPLSAAPLASSDTRSRVRKAAPRVVEGGRDSPKGTL